MVEIIITGGTTVPPAQQPPSTREHVRMNVIKGEVVITGAAQTQGGTTAHQNILLGGSRDMKQLLLLN